MQITSAIALFVAGAASVAAAAARNITYNVVSLQPDNQTIAVIVDDQLYPLTSVSKKSQLLHTGDAPAAASGYRYAVIDKANPSNVIDQESFTRQPVTDDKTLNEYYGRSWNTMNLTQLPTIMSPLPIIDRIKSKLHIDGEIPTIHITGNQSAIDNMHKQQYADIDVKGLSMTYISPHDVQSFEDVTFAVSGFSTRSLPKLSYKLQLSKDGEDLYHYRRFKLRSMAIDFSYMREGLAYAIAESIGLPVGQYSYVRLFLNDQPLGLFGFLDNFKDPWLRNVFNGGEKKGFDQGALYVARPNYNANPSVLLEVLGNTTANPSPTNADKVELSSTMQLSNSDLTYLGDNITAYTQQYSVRENPSSGSANFTRVMELCKFISEQSNTTLDNSSVDLWNEKIDVTSFLRGIAFEVVTSQSDAYLANGNNYLLYDDLENERIVYSNQDFDMSMGTAFFSAETMHGGNYTRFPGFLQRPLTSRLLAVPEFKREIHDLIYNFTRDLVNPDILNPRIDDLYTFLEQDVAWDKSLPRVGNKSLFDAIDPSFNFNQIPFMFGLNGTFPDSTTSSFSLSLKNWLELRSTNLMKFFNETSNQNN
ncbi:DDE_3 domain-containing protein [Mucor velutinosus]|uniref:DDE_3 domain-containing protein n=1 Tax=Mucor velutinosus TaxID=708070 RepID=A0AAN7D6Q0_9FUNG|nr:DDE_3 domain-containing protein [Mucor velutinosus]